LLRNADLAMYQAKANGKGGYGIFDDSMNARAIERLAVETDLRRAIDHHELALYYQPIVALATEAIIGFEVLIRWEHPRRGLVLPEEFIPLAEETGLILPIGRWVLEEACRQMRVWQQRCLRAVPLMLNVNLSVRQLEHPGLVEEVTHALSLADLAGSSLNLEITESAMMGNAASTMHKLRQLEDLQIRLAIDDFGTGYSSLAYLKRFPINILKIDRSFVAGLGRDPHDTAIVRSIISLAKALNLAVTAEGIETAEQLARLRALGCEQGQGFYLGRPMPEPSAGALLATRDEPRLVAGGQQRLAGVDA